MKLVKATPGPATGKSFDELAKRSISQAFRAVEHYALLPARLRQVLHLGQKEENRNQSNDVLYRLCLARPCWTLHAAALDVVESDREHQEALLSERGHHLVDPQTQIIFSWIFFRIITSLS